MAKRTRPSPSRAFEGPAPGGKGGGGGRNLGAGRGGGAAVTSPPTNHKARRARREEPSGGHDSPTAGHEPDESPRAPQQDRGTRRVESILDAAESVFAELGYDAATTNAIAERAGASIGSLYHFFPSKDALLMALATRYAKRMAEINEQAMPLELIGLPPDKLFERIVGGQARFVAETRAFAVIHEATMRRFGHFGPYEVLDEAIMQHVRTFVGKRLPRISTTQRDAVVRACVKVVHALVQESLRVSPAEREPLLREGRAMLARYIERLDHDFGPVPARR